jgi:hypothetical protein
MGQTGRHPLMAANDWDDGWRLKIIPPSHSSGGVSDGDKGDITVTGSGTVWTIDNGLAATVIADGSVSNTEFQYLNGATSNIQAQIDAIPRVYDVAGGSAYSPAPDEIIDTLPMVRTVLFAANFSGSVGYGRADATLSGTYAIDIQDDGVSIGTLTFATNMAATFTTVSGTSKTVDAGSILTFVGQTTVPSQLCCLFYNLKGTLV